MLFSLIRVRVGIRQLTGGVLPLLLAGCGGADLLLPGDGVPAQLRAVSGDGQTAVAGTPVRNPLVVEALDVSGVPVPGAVIVFRFVDPPRGADIAPPTPATDDAGRAAVEVTLGTVAGDQPVEARLADPEHDLSVRFSLTAIQPDDGDGGEGGGGDDEGDDDPPPEDGPDGGGNAGGDDDGDDGGNDDGDDDGDDGGNDDDDGGGRDDDGKDDDGGKGKGAKGNGEDDGDDEGKDEGKDDEDNRGKGSGEDGDDDGHDKDRDDDHGDDDRGHGD